MNAPTRPALHYHGGKWMLAPWIIAHFPAHRVYTEAFGGAASVLMRKPRAKLVEVYNDLDGEIVGLFRVLRDPEAAERLARGLAFTPFARVEFEESYTPAPDPVEQARRTMVRSFMGLGSDSASGAQTGFRANGNRQTAHPAKDWSNLPAGIRAFTERLQGVVIENRDALALIRQHDDIEVLHYCDPPYPHETRSSHVTRTGKGYRHEMTTDQHRELAAVLREVRGMAIASGYACPLYDEDLYAGWARIEREAKADGGLDRVEVLWLNAACMSALDAGRAQSRLIA